MLQSGHQPEHDIADIVQEEDWACNLMLELGFTEGTITRALERFDYDLPNALAFLVYGDQHRITRTNHMKRHTSKRFVPAVNICIEEKRQQYVARASQDLHLNAHVVDLGMLAGTTNNACFWLSMAAALTRSRWAPVTNLRRSLSSFDAAVISAIPSDVGQIQHTSLQALRNVQNWLRP